MMFAQVLVAIHLIMCQLHCKIFIHTSIIKKNFIFSVSSSQQSYSFKTPPPPLNRNENKGAQLMTKMGWEGRGLGANAQVIGVYIILFIVFQKVVFYMMHFIQLIFLHNNFL